MTVPTTDAIWTYPGNGVSVDFPVDDRFLADDDLVVMLVNQTTDVETPQVINTHYTVTGAGGRSGNVRFVTAPITGVDVVIQRIVGLTQPTSVRNQNRYYSTVHEDVFDRLSMADIQQQAQIDRSIRVGPREAAMQPLSGDFRDKYVYINSDGQAIGVTGDASQPITHTTEYQYLVAGQTVVPVSGYTPGAGDLSVHLNGVKLVTGVDYTESSSMTITLTEAADDGDVAILDIGEITDVSLLSVGKFSQDLTATDGQTSITTNRTYVPGLNEIEVFINGALLTPISEYYESTPTSITLLSPMTDGDVVRILYGQAYNPSSGVASVYFPITAVEIAESVVPANFGYPEGDIRRYGTNTTPGVTDMTGALRTAISISNEHRTVLQPETYLTGPLSPPGGASIFMPAGCVLQATNTLGTNERLLNIVNDNVHVVGHGAKVQMIRADYSTGEQRHGVYIYGAQDVVIEGLEATGCGGDGFYVGGGAGDPATRVRLISCKGTNNRRQGLSVVNARNFRDIDGQWTTSNGTAPSAGIDIEPNTTTDIMEDIKIVRPRCTGNDGPGIEIFLANWNSVSNYADIEVISPYTSDNGNVSVSGRFRPGIDINRLGSTTPCKGRIRVVDAKCVDEERAGIHVYDWDINGPLVEIIRPVIINPNQANGSSAPINGGIILYNSTTYTTAPGNVIIESPVIRDDDTKLSANSLATIRIDGLWNDVEITDPRYAYSGNPWSIDASAVVRFNSLKPIPVTVATGTTTVTDGRYLGRVINNTGAGSQSTVALIAGSSGRIGLRMSFEVTAAQQLRIDPNGTDLIRGGTAGQYMVSSTIGDTATIEMDTSTTWKIVARHGTWTYV